MSRATFPGLFTVLIALPVCVPRLTAQSASRTYFSPTAEQAPGGGCQSTTYRLVLALGAGVVARPAASTTYSLAGGFAANLGVGSSGKPWLAGVTPRFAALRGQAPLTLVGTEFDRGSLPSIKIGGQPAVIGARGRDAISTSLPIQPAPGWQPVEITNSLGTTILPKGLGVLPMVMSDPAPASGVGFDLVFKGTQNDLVYWAVGLAQVAPIPLPGFFHGLGLHPSSYLVVAGFHITGASGETRLSIPPTPYSTGTIFVQALFSSTNPGYAPATFSNVLKL